MIEVSNRNGSRISLTFPDAFRLVERIYECCRLGHGLTGDPNTGMPDVILYDPKSKKPLMPGSKPAASDEEMVQRFRETQAWLKGQMPLPFSGLPENVEWTDRDGKSIVGESVADMQARLVAQCAESEAKAIEMERTLKRGNPKEILEVVRELKPTFVEVANAASTVDQEIERAEKAGVPVSAATKAAITQTIASTPPQEPQDESDGGDGGFGQDDDTEYQAELAALQAKQAKRAAEKLAKLEAEKATQAAKPPNHGHEAADDGFAIPKSEIGAMDGREWFLTAHPTRKDMVIAYRKGTPSAVAAGDQPVKQQVEPKTKKSKTVGPEASYEPKPLDAAWMHWAHAAGHAIPAGNHAHAKAERSRLEKKYAELTAPKVDPRAPGDDDGDFGDE